MGMYLIIRGDNTPEMDDIIRLNEEAAGPIETKELDDEVETAQPDTIPGNLDRLLELARLLARENHPAAVELHATYVDLREATTTLQEMVDNPGTPPDSM